MLDVIGGLLMLVLAVLLWAVMGHGIWLLVAAIGRAMFGVEQTPVATPCHQCGAPQGVVRGRCRNCGQVETVALPPSPTSLTGEIQSTLKQLDRLWRRGLMSDDEHQRLRAACHRDLARLQGAAPVQAAPRPQPAEEIVYVEPLSPVPKAGAEAVPEVIEAEIVPPIAPRTAPPPMARSPIHPLDRVEPKLPPVPPSPPRAKRALADVLSGFLQDRNIRWGELVAGLFIVGSVAGLVLNQRDNLNDWIPYFPALLFLLATSALHTAGLYTLRKWKLHATSRGVLTISLLLVPLNFLAAILISGDDASRFPVTSLTYISAVTIGMLAFGAIAYTGAQALVGRVWAALALAVLGPSAVQLMINRVIVGDATEQQALALGSLAVGAFVAGIAIVVGWGWRWKRLSQRRAQPLLMTLGLGGFAVALPLALVLVRSASRWEALAVLSPVLALLGTAVIAAGLFMVRRTKSRQLAPLSVTGLALALLGAFVMLAAVGFAWPDPARLVVVGTLSTIVLATLAFLERSPLLHLPAIACAALATVVGFHWWQGNVSPDAHDFGLQILRTWLMARSGLVLTALAAVVTALGVGLWLRKLRDHAQMLLIGAAALMVLSLLNAVGAGFWHGLDAPLATIIFGVYAIALTAAVVVRPHRVLTVAAALVWLVAGVHALGYNEAVRTALAAREWLPERPVLLTVLVHACGATLVALAVALAKRRARFRREVVEPLALTGFAVSMLATWFAVAVRDQHFALPAGYVSAIALVWITAGSLLRLPGFLTAGQAMSSLAIAYGWLAVAQQQPWWSDRWLDPRTFALVMLGLSIWGALWAAGRRVSRRWPKVHALLAPPWPAADQALLVVMVLVATVGAAWAVSHGALHELSLHALAPEVTEVLQTFRHPTIVLALGAMVAALIVALWEKLDLAWLALLTLIGVVPCALIALRFVDETSAASAFRWALAVYLALCAIFCARDWLARIVRRLPGGWRGRFPEFTRQACLAVALAVTIAPVIAITVIACAGAANGNPPRPPLAETFFADAGWTISYVTPLATIVVCLLALGLRQRESGFVLAGSAVWQFVVTLGCIMPVLTSGGSFDGPLAVTLWQWNVIGLALYCLLWLALERGLTAPHSRTASSLLMLQVGILLASLAGLGLVATAWIVVQLPGGTWPELPFGARESFFALLAAAIAAAWYALRLDERGRYAFAALFSIVAVPFVAAALAPLDLRWEWMSYHVLLTGWLIVASCAAVLACLRRDLRVPYITACGLLATVATFSLFSGTSDPVAAWGTGINVAVLAIMLGLGVFRRRHVLAYASVLLAILATSQAFHHYVPNRRWLGFDFFAANVLAVTLISAFWLAIEIARERNKTSGAVRDRLMPLPLVLTPVLVVFTAGLMLLCLVMNRPGRHWGAGSLLSPANLMAMLALGAYLLGLLWYDRQRIALACLYAWGLIASLMASDAVPEAWGLGLVVLPTCVAVYLALTGWLWQAGGSLADAGRRLGVHEPIHALERAGRWLPLVTIALGAIVVLFDLGFVLGSGAPRVRYAAGFGPALLALGLVAQAQVERRTLMMYLSLLSATLAAVLLSWAELPAGFGGLLWLRRLVRLIVVLGSLSLLYAAVLPRLWSQWTDWLATLRRMAITCATGASAALVLLLVLEASQFVLGRPPELNHAEVGVVAVVLVLLAGTLIVLAVSPTFAQRRGFGASESMRMGYVYAAQVLVALAFGHLYLTRPYWFDGLLRPYWPYIVMAIAFAGVSVGEWFQRLKLRVLAEPLQRSGAFLPLLPAIGWWIEASRGTPTTDYALVMFVVGLAYVMLSIFRQSPWSAAAAALSGNIALWALMSDRGMNFLAHPQFWLIPPAVSVLAAVHVYQKRLSEEQLTASRYVCMLVIYLSSTSEIFITGITSIWPPLALAALAVVGVLVGIALQIRAFLYLGTSFVFLSMVTMVWHASHAFDQVWPWWVFGICVGLAMLVLFGLFEKKRVEITALVERLRQWEH